MLPDIPVETTPDDVTTHIEKTHLPIADTPDLPDIQTPEVIFLLKR